jgi:hypothetical protein
VVRVLVFERDFSWAGVVVRRVYKIPFGVRFTRSHNLINHYQTFSHSLQLCVVRDDERAVP